MEACHHGLTIRMLKSRTILLFLVILVMWPACIRSVDIFDTSDVPENSDMTSMQISKVRTRSQRRNSLNPSNDAPMPESLEVDFVCWGRPVHLQLDFQGESSPQLSDYLDDQQQDNFTLTAEDIPVFTQSGRSRTVFVDNFPRLYSKNCRTYGDSENQAAFLVISDPVFKSYKFFGSFTMGGAAYFVQPYSLHNLTENGRMHITTRMPELEFSFDTDHPAVRIKDMQSGRTRGIRPRGTVNQRSMKDMLSSLIRSTSDSLPADVQELLKNQESQNGAGMAPNGNSGTSGSSLPQTRETNAKEEVDIHRMPTSSQDSSSLPKSNFEQFSSQGSTNNDKAPFQGSTVTKSPRFKRLFSKWRPKQRSRRNVAERSGRHNRYKRQAPNKYTVEVVFVCDYSCYLRFQELYGLTSEQEVKTKNVISLFFSYVREYLQISYGSVFQLYPQLNTDIKMTVPAMFIASKPDVKVIGDYLLGDNEVDSEASLFEFALWVQDSLKVPLKADHYALVTGYNLYAARFVEGVVGQVTRIPSVCDIDSVSVNEIERTTLTPGIITHEIGHSLGAQHDSLTGGICENDDFFIMAAAIGGEVPEDKEINTFRFSFCSAFFFSQELPSRQCLKTDDFDSSALPGGVPRLGQQFGLEEQCGIVFEGSALCRDRIIQREGSWDRICSTRTCDVPPSTNCFGDRSFEYSSCGNKRWCLNGVCQDDVRAPEKVVDCPAGDSPRFSCDVSQCESYSPSRRFLYCCDTCRPIKTERFVKFTA